MSLFIGMRAHHSVCVEVGCFSPSLYFEPGCFLVLLFLSRGLARVFSNHPPVSVSQLVLSAGVTAVCPAFYKGQGWGSSCQA